jgi:hypothetical protein
MIRARKFMALSLALAAILTASCGKDSSRKPTYPVTGKVVLPGGKAPEHATVVLHPVDESGPDVVKPSGKVEKDGTFSLTTYESRDGAPAGKYYVTVELWLASGKGDEGPKNRLPARYARPETSGLTATVSPSPTDLQPIVLKR